MLLDQKLLGIKGLETKHFLLRGGVAMDVSGWFRAGQRKAEN
jgi:hypothetical protein